MKNDPFVGTPTLNRGHQVRPPRFTSRTGNGPEAVRIAIHGKQWRVLNMSMGGVAVRLDDEKAVRALEGEVSCTLSVGGHGVHAAKARLVRQQAGKGGYVVGLAWTDCALDIGRIRQACALERVAEKLEIRPWQAFAERVPKDYKAFCQDMLVWLTTYREATEELEAGRTAAAADTTRLDTLFGRLKGAFLEEWKAYRARGAALTRDLTDPADIAAAQAYTEAAITRQMVAGPIWHRSYTKPLGYPGDYEVMNLLYANAEAGDTLFGRLCHLAGLEYGSCIPERMAMVTAEIRKLLGTPGEPAEVTSIGCGPSVEVRAALEGGDILRGATFTLVDQEEQALLASYEGNQPVALRTRDDIHIRVKHMTVGEMTTPESLRSGASPQDLIYCVGLTDYLSGKVAKSLALGLFSMLKPGGLLVVGNLVAGQDQFWPATYMLDWDMVYRTKADMEGLVSEAPGAQVRLAADSTGYQWMMYVRRGPIA